MKKVFKWLLRVLCVVIIGAAAITFARSLLHINDDHSYEALMGPRPETTVAAPAAEPGTEQTPSAAPTQAPQLIIALESSGTATMEEPEVTLTATFTNIQGSLNATLNWYLDGELLDSEEKLLVNGATASYVVDVDVAQAEADDVVAELMVALEDGSEVSTGTIFQVARVQTELDEVRTEEIAVTCVEDCSIYTDKNLSRDTGGIMYAGETGLLLAYEMGSGGLGALHLQFPDGSDGWVSARRCEITQEKCTTDLDYTEDQKAGFVNDMGYESDTYLLVWVSLYTQKVNVFYTEGGDWIYYCSFPCASGANDNPTTTGVYSITEVEDQWDLGDTYVSPVMVFNGGEAFTSQPRSAATGLVADDTMGEPGSGGSVWMLQDDIDWMAEYVPKGTAVVVY